MPIVNTETIFEYDTTKNFNITDAEEDVLERLQNALNIEILRTKRRGGEVQSFQYVGVVNLGRRAVQILPKIYKEESHQTKEERARLATRNLLSLLRYAGELKIYETDIAPLIARDLSWLEILITLFSKHLLYEWKRGVIKNYEEANDDLSVVRGKLRLNEQLRKPARNHIFSVTYDELSVDNKINRILKYVTDKLLQISQDHDNRRSLLLLNSMMSQVTLLPVIRYEDAKNISIDRLNKRYEPIINMALLFLANKSGQLSTGDQSSFAFVFDMNKLFEAFVTNFIVIHQQHILPSALQDCLLIPQSRGIKMALAKRNGEDVITIKPDLVFKKGDSFPLIIDTKYKVLTNRNQTMLNGDFSQMYIYSKKFKCSNVLVIYPQTEHLSQKLAPYDITDEDSIVSMSVVDLRTEIDSNEGRDYLVNYFKSTISDLFI